MPTVARYSGPQVATAPLPGVRVAGGAPSAAFGIPGNPAPDLSGVERVLAERQAKARQDADQIVALDADTKLTTLRNRVLYDPDHGVLNQHGVNALGAADQAAEAWQRGVSDIEGSLATDDQKLTLRRLATHHWADVSADVERHVFTEGQAHDQATTDAALNLTYDDAVRHASDPERVAAAIDKGKIIAEGYAARRGYSPAETQTMVSALVSRAHLGVVESLSTQQQDLAAASYFAKHRDEFTGKDLVEGERLAADGSLRGESQRQADGITAKATSLSAGLEAARAIKDPRVRDEVEQRVRRTFLDRQQEASERQAQAFHEGSAIVERTGDFYAVPLKLRMAMSPEENAALQHRSDQIRHPKRDTDLETYNSLMNLAGLSAATRQVFERTNLASYRNHLSEEDFQSLLGVQLSMRRETMNGETRAGRKAADRQAAIETLRALGVTVAPPPAVPGAPMTPPEGAPAAPAGSEPAQSTPASPAAAAPAPAPPVGTVGTVRGSVQQRIPAAWLEHAKRDPEYRKYLEHMGYNVDDALPDAAPGNIDLRPGATP